MKHFLMQSVHAEKVAAQMNRMYGDFGKFTAKKGNVTVESSVDIRGQVLNEVSVYASGYSAALDEYAELLAALEAITERAEDVSVKIPVENRSEGVSQAAHVRHMASHLAQHAKIARAAIAKAKGE